MPDEKTHPRYCCTRNAELRYIQYAISRQCLSVCLSPSVPNVCVTECYPPLACHRLIARNFIDCRVNVRRVTACENKGGRKEDLVIVQMMPLINTLYKTWFRSRSIVTDFSASARFLKANTLDRLHTWTHGSTSRARTTSCMPRALRLLPPAPQPYTPRSSLRCRAAQRPL